MHLLQLLWSGVVQLESWLSCTGSPLPSKQSQDGAAFMLTPVLAPAPAELQELFPNIIPQLGQENMAQMRNLHAQMQVGGQS